MRVQTRLLLLGMLVLAAAPPAHGANGGWTVTGWNNLGMHCMDSDYSVMSILPPYNTLHAQLMDPAGNLVRNGAGYVVTYEAVADPSGSINTTSIGKSDFWQYAQSLFGLLDPLPPDTGLTGIAMPGPANVPQPMTYDATNGWWVAEGVPLTPYDDASMKNPYPLFRIKASSAGTLLASTDIVAPVSDEMACKACHASGSGPAARPAAGWVDDPDPERDYRLNAILLHDERRGGSTDYAAMLTRHGYDPAGLHATVTLHGKPILCATCHASNALGTGGEGGVPSLTSAMHALHASVTDPSSGLSLEDTANRSACYTCHPGSTTRCLRGAMGNAVAADGSMAMQCQSCHGRMSQVGAAPRVGWLDEPNCQNCHTGTAVHNNGQIRYTNVYDVNGERRVAVDATFATTPDTPAPGFSLYRFSTGHGGVKCEGCHGSTHAEYPSSHRNDNLQSIALQGHAGVLVECATCHAMQPATVGGGPHGMHPVGQAWVSGHADAVEANGVAPCRACHGADDRGSVLSYSKADRMLATDFGARHFWPGFRIGCYACHDGATNEAPNPNHPAVVEDVAAISTGVPTTIALVAHDADGDALALRVVAQPARATVSISGTTATFRPLAGSAGTDTFTYAAWDGDTDSNLGTVVVQVRPDLIFANGFDGA
ncbi:Ig-like domain-containing protein [Dokdonella sp.]|uniref:Ig-like domain-containing protein n=1 Tax=Dokdonella sp. TaxID=2291710 RepID=UPI002F42E2FC